MQWLTISLQLLHINKDHFGHDDCDSLLRNEEIESQSIHLEDLPEDELSLAFLFGGVGDARHPMATLLDAHANPSRS